MRRSARTLIVIAFLWAFAVSALAFQTFNIRDFERGEENTPLGLKLGLDLQGGLDLRYQAVLKDPFTDELVVPSPDQMEALKRTIERRVNASGLGEPNIQILGNDRLLIQLPGVTDTERAKSLIGETARLEIKHRTLNVARDIPNLSSDDIVSIALTTLEKLGFGPGLGLPSIETTTTEPGPAGATSTESVQISATTTEPTPGGAPATSTEPTTGSMQATTTAAAGEGPETDAGVPVLVLEFTDKGAQAFAKSVEHLRESLEPMRGTNRTFLSYLTISAGRDTVAPAQVPYAPVGFTALGELIALGLPPLIQRVEGTNRFNINLAAVAGMEEATFRFGAVTSTELRLGEVLGKLDEDIGLTGDDLTRAFPGQHQTTGLPIIHLEFNADGTKKFAEITSRIAGTPDTTPFILDNLELIAPVARSAITGGSAIIDGPDFTFEFVRDTALMLESGRLPIPIELIRERDVDAILGADSLARSVRAGLIGLALVLLFMALYYRAAGVVAAVALIIYATLVLAIFKLLPITLTLSGVAAVILSIGMAVDANILIFERMKEELRAGRTLLSAINIGFNRAWSAIRDSNVSTLITCAILFWFADQLGATIVQDFALALAIGVATSMFTAITVSRTLLRLLTATPLGKRLSLFAPSGTGELPQQRVTSKAI